MSRAGTRLLGWTLAVLVIAFFVHLGLWQQRRAVEKQAMLNAAAQVLKARHAVPLASAADPVRRHDYDWSAGEGEFDSRGPLWLDNQQRDGRAGVRAYRIFNPERGVPLLVDLGWLLTRVDIARLGEGLGLPVPLAPRVLRLDPALPLGYPRDLELLANTLTPATHRGYAVQWFALALTVLITAVLLTFRKGSR